MDKALLPYVPGMLLMIFRTGGMVFSLPFLGRSDENRWPRLVLVVGLGVMLYLPNPVLIPISLSAVHFLILVIREILVGLLLGIGINTIFGCVRVAGEFIGRDMGLSMARVVDPSTGSGGVVMATFFEVLTVLLFLAVNGHHVVFKVLDHVNGILPLGTPFNVGIATMGLANMGSKLLENGILIAAPAFTIMLLLTITMLILSRAVPQLHLMEFGFALRILIGFLACSLVLVGTLPKMKVIFTEVFNAVTQLFVPI